MKEKFSAFYRYSTEEELKKVWKDEKTLFVFDTNILLSIYSYNTQARDTFFSMLESLNGRVWLPFHVGLEYQRNRIKIIKEASSNLDKLKQRISEFKDRLNYDEKKIEAINNDFRVVFDQHESLKDSFNNYIADYKEFLDKSKSDLTNKENEFFIKVDRADIEIMKVDGYDKIRDRFDEIFSVDKVGNCLFDSIEDVNKFNEEAKKRFDNEIPPGFKDAKEKGDASFFFGGFEYYNKYGDLIIFKELINKAKNNKNLIDNLIFITDDSKEDWIESIKINDEKVKLGVLPLLKDEILRETGIKNFKIIDQQTFAENSGKFSENNDAESLNNLIFNIKHINLDNKDDGLVEIFDIGEPILNPYYDFKNFIEKGADALNKYNENRDLATLSDFRIKFSIKGDLDSLIKDVLFFCSNRNYFKNDILINLCHDLIIKEETKKTLTEEYEKYFKNDEAYFIDQYDNSYLSEEAEHFSDSYHSKRNKLNYQQRKILSEILNLLSIIIK
ncbi:PIN-like domain-containing protein [Acinetobacter soli]|uniref:PIN like domain-containing protein n=1 Tax=Acinetobacter soli TaxID=487316 RepID=A0A1P8ENA9_9GAMM|nr:PIN-like domain-containing protein [Acinetobacter soli]APV37714.1 hypothetical protein BEN76_16840 [Acinetobacter soli]